MKNPNQAKVCMGKNRECLIGRSFFRLGWALWSRADTDKNPVRANNVAMSNVIWNMGV